MCLKIGDDLDFHQLAKKVELISITGGAADKNYTELSQRDMSITHIRS